MYGNLKLDSFSDRNETDSYWQNCINVYRLTFDETYNLVSHKCIIFQERSSQNISHDNYKIPRLS